MSQSQQALTLSCEKLSQSCPGLLLLLLLLPGELEAGLGLVGAPSIPPPSLCHTLQSLLALKSMLLSPFSQVFFFKKNPFKR